jgi:hypothetical protein
MFLRIRGLAMAALLLAAAPASVSWATGQDDALRPEVGKPLQAAQGLIKQKKFKEALAQIKKAESAAPLSAKETGLLEQLRGIAAAGTGDNAAAIKSFEAAIASGKLAPADQLRLIQTVAGLSYQAKDYPTTVVWVKRYQEAGGADEPTLALLAQAYYANADWANAAATLNAQIAAVEKAGRKPTEAQLQLLVNAENKQADPAGYQAALEKLVADYPKPEYWGDVIQRLLARPGFSRRLTLDVYRLAQSVGALSSTRQYTEAAELALAAGLPGEAKTLLDQGFASKALGAGPEADRQKRLLALAVQKKDDQQKTIDDSEKKAATAADGVVLVNTGLDYLGFGQPQRAAALIEQGLAKGVQKNPDEAKLHLAIAYYAAGQKDKALEIFRSVQSGDAADLARLWVIHLSQH